MSVLDDAAVRRWFVRDPTVELRFQLKQSVCTLIALGVLRDGDALPGIKRVVKLVEGLYPSVLFHVYKTLELEGVLKAEQGRRYFIISTAVARHILGADVVAQAVHACRRLGLTCQESTWLLQQEIERQHRS